MDISKTIGELISMGLSPEQAILMVQIQLQEQTKREQEQEQTKREQEQTKREQEQEKTKQKELELELAKQNSSMYTFCTPCVIASNLIRFENSRTTKQRYH